MLHRRQLSGLVTKKDGKIKQFLHKAKVSKLSTNISKGSKIQQ